MKLGEYLIPLIGIPKDAALETCDLCHEILPIWEVEFTGSQYLCTRCRLPHSSVSLEHALDKREVVGATPSAATNLLDFTTKGMLRSKYAKKETTKQGRFKGPTSSNL